MESNDIPLVGVGGGGGGDGFSTVIDNSSLPMSALKFLCCCNNVLF